MALEGSTLHIPGRYITSLYTHMQLLNSHDRECQPDVFAQPRLNPTLAYGTPQKNTAQILPTATLQPITSYKEHQPKALVLTVDQASKCQYRSLRCRA